MNFDHSVLLLITSYPRTNACFLQKQICSESFSSANETKRFSHVCYCETTTTTTATCECCGSCCYSQGPRLPFSYWESGYSCLPGSYDVVDDCHYWPQRVACDSASETTEKKPAMPQQVVSLVSCCDDDDDCWQQQQQCLWREEEEEENAPRGHNSYSPLRRVSQHLPQQDCWRQFCR